MNAGVLTIELAANVARLSNDMAQAKKIVGDASSQMSQTIGTLKSLLGTLGVGLSVGYFVSFIRGTNDAIAHMKELGQEAGTSGEAISRFEAPARSAGLSLDTVAAAMFRMSKASLEAKDPTSKAAQALEAIGIKTSDLKGLKPDEMFELVARSISKYSDGLGKNNVMQELAGKSGREMNRVMAEIAERGQLNATVTQEQIEASKKLNDQLLDLKMNSEKFWRSMVSEGVPAMNDIIKAFIKAKEEGGFLSGAIAAFQQTFTGDDLHKANVELTELTSKLLDAQNELSAMRSKGSVWRAFFGTEEFYQRNVDRLKAQIETVRNYLKELTPKAPGVAPTGKKSGIDFDPVEAEKRRKIAFEQAKQLQEDQDDAMKGLLAHYAHLNALRDEEIALSQKYQDVAAAEIAMRAKQGEAIAQGLDTEAQIEQRSYEERLAQLLTYFAAKEDFTAQDQARLEALTLEHEAKLGNLFAQGALERLKFDAMTWDMQAKTVTGSIVAITQTAATGNKRMFELNKLAAEADIIVSTSQGIMKAWGQGGWFGIGLAALIGAAGAANLARVRATTFGGGGGVAASVSGAAGGALPVLPVASPAPGTGQSPVVINVNIVNNAPIVGVDGADQLVHDIVIPGLRDAIGNNDVVIISPNSRQAQDIRAPS